MLFVCFFSDSNKSLQLNIVSKNRSKAEQGCLDYHGLLCIFPVEKWSLSNLDSTCFERTCTKHTHCKYTKFCTADWYRMHVTSRHHWGIPSVPVPIHPNLSMTMRGCGAKQKHNKNTYDARHSLSKSYWMRIVKTRWNCMFGWNFVPCW